MVISIKIVDALLDANIVAYYIVKLLFHLVVFRQCVVY